MSNDVVLNVAINVSKRHDYLFSKIRDRNDIELVSKRDPLQRRFGHVKRCRFDISIEISRCRSVFNTLQVTLGGSRWMGNACTEVDPHESASIWERCVRVVPSLARAQVQRQWVGLRPFRCPVRTELEQLPVQGRQPIKASVHSSKK